MIKVTAHYMDFILLFVVAFLSIILIYIYQYNVYHTRPSFHAIPYRANLILDIRLPYRVKNHLNNFSQWNIHYFNKEYGDELVYVLHSTDSTCSVKNADIIPMPLKEYIEKYIWGEAPDKRDYYFKSEDAYQFLKSVGLERTIEEHFKDKLPFHQYFSTSFWLGPKGSTTTFHYDTDHSNFLCLLEGTKRIYLVSPEASHKMNTIKTSYGDYWSDFDLSNNKEIERMKEKEELFEIILQPGEILNIPSYIWHAVENLENTVSFTFHYYTMRSRLFNFAS